MMHRSLVLKIISGNYTIIFGNENANHTPPLYVIILSLRYLADVWLQLGVE